MLTMGVLCGLGVTGVATMQVEEGRVIGTKVKSFRTETSTGTDVERRGFLAKAVVDYAREKNPAAVWVEIPEQDGATTQIRNIRNTLLVGEILGSLRQAGLPTFEATRNVWFRSLGLPAGGDVESALQRRLGVAMVGQNEQQSMAAGVALYGATGGLWTVRTRKAVAS